MISSEFKDTIINAKNRNIIYIKKLAEMLKNIVKQNKYLNIKYLNIYNESN